MSRSPRNWRLPAMLALGVVAIVAGIGVSRLAPTSDVAAFFGGDDDDAHREAAEVLGRFGTLDTLLVDIALTETGDSAPPEARTQALERAGDEVAAALEATGLFSAVHFRLDADARKRSMERLFERRFSLLAPPTDLDAAMAHVARQLMLPGGLDRVVLRDPFEHRAALGRRARAAAPRMNLADGATLLSQDGQHALIIAEPKTRALDVEAGRALLTTVRSVLPRGVDVEILGAHVFAEAAADSIKQDVRTTVAATILLVLLIFGVVFRHPLPVFVVTAPVAFGGLVAAGTFGLFDIPIHGITLGFSAVLVGVGVDYGAHLLLHLRASDNPGATLRRVLPSVGMGALTTLAALATLLLADTGALTEMVWFTGIGVVASFVACVVLVPMLEWRRTRPPTAHYPSGPPPAARATVFGAALLVAGLAGGLGSLRFDGNVRHLDYQPEHVRHLEQTFADRYDNPRYPTLIVARGDTVDAALRQGDRIAELLEQARERGDIGSFLSLSRILPSEHRQAETLARWNGFAERLTGAAEAVELRPEAFQPLLDDLAAARTTGPLTPDDLAATPFESLVHRTLIADAEAPRPVELLTVAYLSGAADPSARELPAELRDALTAHGSVTVISPAGLASSTVRRIKREIVDSSVFALLVVFGLLLFYYRRLAPALWALVPVFGGFVASFGLLGWLGIPVNIVSVGAFALVAGIGVDYGIFVTDSALETGTTTSAQHLEALGITRRAVGLAAATTLAGFGTLLLANSPVMWSLGLAVTVGVSASLLLAVVVLPAAWHLVGPPVAEQCSRCNGPVERPRDRAAWFQLTVLSLLAGLVILAWLGGDRAADNASLWLALGIDAAWIGWLIHRLRHRPRRCPKCDGPFR